MKQAFFIINTLTSNPQLDINTIQLKLLLDLRIKNNTNSFAITFKEVLEGVNLNKYPKKISLKQEVEIVILTRLVCDQIKGDFFYDVKK